MYNNIYSVGQRFLSIKGDLEYLKGTTKFAYAMCTKIDQDPSLHIAGWTRGSSGYTSMGGPGTGNRRFLSANMQTGQVFPTPTYVNPNAGSNQKD